MTDTLTVAAGRSPQIAKGGRTLWAISAGHGIADAYTAFLPVLLPILAIQYGLAETMLALLVVVFALTSSLPGPALGHLADRIGHGRIAALSIAISALTLSMLASTPSAIILFVTVAIAGLGSAALHPAGSTLARAGGVNAETAVATFSAGGMLGYAVGPIIVMATLAGFGTSALPWLAIPGVLVAGALFFLLPAEKAEISIRNSAEMGPNVLRSSRVVWITLAGAFAFLPFTAAVNGIPIWLTSVEGLAPDSRWIGLSITIFSFAGAVGGVALGLVARRIPRRTVLIWALIAGTVALQATLWSPPGSFAFVVALMFGGANIYAATPLLVVSVQDLAPRAAAAAAGMVFGISAGLAALLYLGIGFIQQEIGVEEALRISFASPLVAAAILARAMQDRTLSQQQSEDTALETICRCLSAGALGSPSEARCSLTDTGKCGCG